MSEINKELQKIIVINGQGGVGKDTFIDILNKKGLKIANVSSVDGVKELARMVGWNGAKEDKDRKFLSDLKILTTKYCGFSENYLAKKANEFLESDNDLMFVHIREPFYIQDFLNKFPTAKTLLIKRKDIYNYGNMADDGVFDFNYNYVVENYGTLEELEIMATQFVNDMIFQN